MIELANPLLTAAGLASMAIAILHLAIIFYGAPGYRYFGAGEKMVSLAENGSFVPGFVTWGITIVFTVFGLYAFSGAELLSPLPFLQIVLFGIGTIYTLRGLFVIYEIFTMLVFKSDTEFKRIMFSLVSFLVGVFYLFGTLYGFT